jgi:atrial natriuretic peptide receptor A
MLSAHKLGMTKGEYVFINIDVSTGSHNLQPWKRGNDSSEENQTAKEAYRALKTISLRRSNQPQYQKFEKRVCLAGTRVHTRSYLYTGTRTS